MPKANMNALLKQRMSAAQQASELQEGEAAYERLFEGAPPPKSKVCDLPVDKLTGFFTADIGFKPYPQARLEAFAQQLNEEGLFERIIVRPVPGADTYEILAGHNRVAAGRLNGWKTIPAEIVEADDARAITIATATNLLRRQDLTILERGQAYRALLEAHEHQGYRCDIVTSGDYRPKLRARTIVAEFFNVTEYEIRKAVKLTALIPPLAELVDQGSKALNLACAEMIADYDPETQEAFVELCSIEGYQLNKAAMKHIRSQCPPPAAGKQSIFAAWREARAAAERRMMAPPKKITFERKRFEPYLERLGGEKELEKLFLDFLKERVAV